MTDKYIAITDETIGKMNPEELAAVLGVIMRRGIDSRNSVEKCGLYCVILNHIQENTSPNEKSNMKTAMDAAKEIFGSRK